MYLTKILFTKKFKFKLKFMKLEKKKIVSIHKLKEDLNLIRYEKKINFINNIDIGLSI